MRLTRLELSGFKSFADSVTLNFEEGVTAIVGPNGCGKSNVSDAVRWVLGEQSARLLRGGKMEDVIFQGTEGRRPVNLAHVSLYLDNTDGELPIAYQEVVITRRLSRSGASDYLINNSPVRLRDVQDLLRGTGLGGDAGVVIEAKAIDRLLSDRADERRALFEEAAGIGLYRDRKHASERRLEETGQDLQRVEDLIAEVQSQIRSLARQKGKTERHAKLTEERFAVTVTLAGRHLERLASEAAAMEQRFTELGELVPALRARLEELTGSRTAGAEARGAAETARSEAAARLAEARLALGKLEGELALATERLANASARRIRAEEERAQAAQRGAQAAADLEAATAELARAEEENAGMQAELTARAADEESSRTRVADVRRRAAEAEESLQRELRALRALEGERQGLVTEQGSVQERLRQVAADAERIAAELGAAERRRDMHVEQASHAAYETRRAAEALDAARQDVAAKREAEGAARRERRAADERLAPLVARRDALEQLERDRTGLAPASAALLRARAQFGDGIVGPLSDFLSTSREDAELAERLLGDWMHAVLVRDGETVEAVRTWHADAKPGTLLLLPIDREPAGAMGAHDLADRIRADGPAGAWVRAALAGTEVLDGAGKALRRASGAVLLAGEAPPSGPLRRRAELATLRTDIETGEAAREAAEAALVAASAQVAEAEQALRSAEEASAKARDAERQAVAAREEALRLVTALGREQAQVTAEAERLRERLARAETRLGAIDGELETRTAARSEAEALRESLRTEVVEAEQAQEAAREARTASQVRGAQVTATLRAARERVERDTRTRGDADRAAATLAEELGRLEAEIQGLEGQRGEWAAEREQRLSALVALELAVGEADTQLLAARAALDGIEQELGRVRDESASLAEERHVLELRLTESAGQRNRIIERIESEWKKPYEELAAEVTPLDLDLETLEAEAARIAQQLEQIGPVNPLAVEEHAEESKRLDFLTSQRDDLVSARQSLQQAIREIDGTARQMFLETFNAVQGHFQKVFLTLFGGGECDLRLTTPDDPLESEIEIHAAPRGKKTQRIHLLSSGERTLVAVSLLFSIYLTKPSPFCLMDEVDAPLDDANVGRFTRLLDEFKASTQFLVITHNPRTMQSADSIYGVTMQEPGVSTIVGVRLGEQAAAAATA